MENNLKEATHDLDSNYGRLSLNQDTLNNISIEIGKMSVDVLNTDKNDTTVKAIQFNDISHRVQLLADLLQYTMRDMSTNMKELDRIKGVYYQSVIRNSDGDER